MKFKNYTKRSIKPRENGVTSLINFVMSIEIMKSYVQENHYLIDYKKLGQVTALIKTNLKKN
jgi:phosphosulfolactate synthase (CoM biosynthesis protein A)